MKIALVVYRIGPSHGSLLQTYALYKTLQEMGHEITILDRQRNMSLYRKIRNVAARIKNMVIHSYKGPIFYTGDYSPISMKELNIFFKKYLATKTFTFSKANELERIAGMDFDCFIVGSDQTWRPTFVYDVRYYYLNFLPDNHPARRIAYAPSFGTSEWEYSPWLEEECKDCLVKFSAVSVREDDGVDLCQKHFGVKATHVLDPTMLLKREDYLSLFDNSKARKRKLLSFSVLDKSELATDIIQRISHRMNIDLYQINASHNYTVADWIEPGIDKWLEGIYQAEFVVTDSFHATVFSILMNTPFVTIVNASRGISRIKSLLSMFGLEDRMVDSLEQVTDEQLFREIDWKKVNNRLEAERYRSLVWLKEAIEK